MSPPKDQQDSSSSPNDNGNNPDHGVVVDNNNNNNHNESLLEDAAAAAQHLIVIRHGDRWDYENPEAWATNPYSRKGDPPLSALGHEQARQVGRYLNGFFEQHNITADDITWMSSPFLRTIQTSTEALNSMTLEGSKEIPILPEDGVFEWDGKGGEWHASLPNIQERLHYFPRLLNSATNYTSLHVPTLPEPRSQFLERCRSTISAMNQRHAYKPKSALVIVSHAAACIGLAVAATNHQYADITPAAPCSIYQMVRWDNTPVWTLDAHNAPHSKNGYTQHLSSLGSHTVPWNNFGDKSIHLGYTGPPTSRFAPESLKKELLQRQQKEELECDAQ